MEIRIGTRSRMLQMIAYMLVVMLGIAYARLHQDAARTGGGTPLPDLHRGRILAAGGEPLAVTLVDKPGTFQQKATRHYPNGMAAAQVIGVMGVDAGIEGMERTFDAQLKTGRDLHLTLDLGLQAAAQDAIDRAVKERQAEYGAVIMIETRTGRILAMAGSPSFDPNNWRSATTEQRRNRAVLDAYEPGSVIKAMTVAAAMDDGLVQRRTQFDIPMRQYVPGSDSGRWGSTIGDSVAHGRSMDTEDILRFSSNVGISMLTTKMTNEQLRAHMEAFGMGEAPDVPGLPTATGWLQPKKNWNPLVRATTGFGQGMTATLLQTALAYNTLANGGRRIPARIVEAVPGSAYEGELTLAPVTEGGAQSPAQTPAQAELPQTAAQEAEAEAQARAQAQAQAGVQVVKPETAQEISKMLRMVIEIGLPKAIMIEGYPLSGKTGTAQVVVDGRYSSEIYKSTFAGYFPTNDPEVTVAVMGHGARSGHHGSEFAAPVFTEVMGAYISQRGRAPIKGIAEEQEDLLKRRNQGEFRR